ncbi:MAG TPA: helix-turn-helix transcriptional regulator [Pseudonocardiaceae bacterium]|nr:helix-turn-helix transcriptional regulator [Pseudonocardiaceae bacterium]
MDINQRCNVVNNRAPRARVLGTALRKARMDRELGLREFAKEICRDPSLLCRWESGERAPLPTEVAQILGQLGISGRPYDEIMELANGTDDPRWLATTLGEQRVQLNALIELERVAKTITGVAPLLIPGLLQISDYTRAIMSAGGTVPADEISTRVAARMGRREVLTRNEPVQLTALIGEAALHHQIGSRQIMADQLAFLTEMAQRSNVEVRVLPYDSGWHPGLEGPFVLIDGDTANPAIHIEVRGTGMMLHTQHDVDAYRQAADKVTESAISAEDSLVVIALAKARWESA